MHEIIVTNIGTIYSGDNFQTAKKTYRDYIDRSKNGMGRAAGESVTWMTDGEIVKEYVGEFPSE